MNANDIILSLANVSDHIRRYEIMLPNVFIQHDSEADLFCIRKSGLCDEFEVKISRADFFNDSKKFVQYRNMTEEEYKGAYLERKWADRFDWPNYKTKYQALIDGNMCVNYFWYAIKKGIVEESEVPEWAGLIVFYEKDGKLNYSILRQPKKLHKNKMPIEDRYKIAKKSTYRLWKLKNEIQKCS